MAERSLRGMKIGASSLETDEGVRFVARSEYTYTCPNGHVFHKTFAEEADVPALWECHCGANALLENAEEPEDTKKAKPQRTHWDMLRERRTIEELDELLEERMELITKRGLRSRL
ncbi:MAG: RNA polymerase-binding protein RbpA [Flaviflexus sp.]|uniref:RNA polymerase-binding protein RbpA n=1 Tax=Flaviflexus sp. TaxID=1969482 RepID=UPI00352CDB93